MVILLGASWQAFGHVPEDGAIHAMLGPLILKTLPLEHQFDSAYSEGLGAVVEGDIDKHGGAEISAIYMHQLYSIKRGNQIVVEKAQRMYVSTGYRNWFTPRFSAAIAFDSSFAMGEAQLVHNDFGYNNSPATTAQESVAYGFDASVQYEAIQSGRYSLVVDARYAYSITNKPQEDGNILFLMVGIKYYVQSHEAGLH